MKTFNVTIVLNMTEKDREEVLKQLEELLAKQYFKLISINEVMNMNEPFPEREQLLEAELIKLKDINNALQKSDYFCDRCAQQLNETEERDNRIDEHCYCDKCFAYLDAMADIEMERQKEEGV